MKILVSYEVDNIAQLEELTEFARAMMGKKTKKSKPVEVKEEEVVDDVEEEIEIEAEEDDEEVEEEKPQKASKKSDKKSGPTRDDVIEAMQAFAEENSRREAIAILKKFKVKSVHELAEDDLPKIMKMLV